jgi:hypothetical protein
MGTKQRHYVCGGLLLCAGLIVLLACGSGPPRPTPFPTLRPTPTPVALPNFLFFVFPEPGSTIRGLSLAKEVWAILNLPAIAEIGETLTPEDLQERTGLLVDGHSIAFELSEDYGEGPRDKARVWVSFSPDPGEHRATIRVRRTSGEMLEFSWVFTVDENAGAIPGLPEGFQFVRPLPDSTITRQEYRGGDSVPAEYVPGFAILDGGVCYGILGSKVVEPGEILEAEEVGKKARFVTLDGMSPGPDADIRGGADLGLYEVYDATGQVITSYGGAQHYECWQVDLAPGRHEVTVRIERASGQVTEFTWWFVITK